MNGQQRWIIEQLYLEMFPKLHVYACCSLESEALAEEAVQETFRIACQKPEQLCESANPRGWLVQTLKYTIHSMQNTRAADRRMVEKYLMIQLRETSISEDQIKLGVLYENVADTEAFKLLAEMAIEGRSYLEMANSRGISASACKKRVQRAREKLREKMKI